MPGRRSARSCVRVALEIDRQWNHRVSVTAWRRVESARSSVTRRRARDESGVDDSQWIERLDGAEHVRTHGARVDREDAAATVCGVRRDQDERYAPWHRA